MTLNKAWIEKWIKEYDKNHVKERALENEIFTSIEKIGSPRYLTKDILTKIVEWKAPRAKGHMEKNNDSFIKEVTQISLSTNNERLKIGILTLLSGVKIRMASTILFFCFPDRYTVMDKRAWESLKHFGKKDGAIKDTFECWRNYNDLCLKIAKENEVSLRELDKALWQYNGG